MKKRPFHYTKTVKMRSYTPSIKGHSGQIKRAVEELFSVRVMAVNTMRRKGKKKRERTANYGTTAAWKRAVVTLHADDSINLI